MSAPAGSGPRGPAQPISGAADAGPQADDARLKGTQAEGAEGDRQPEALRTFEAAARSGGVKPEEQGLTARHETTPPRDDTARKAETATRVLEAGIEKKPEDATKAVQESKDPRIP